MAYCTAQDIRLLTGIIPEDIDDTTMESIISISDRKCDARMGSAGLTVPLSSDPTPSLVRDASANYAVSILIERKLIDLTRPNSYSAEGYSFAIDPVSEIARHNAAAADYLNKYITSESGTGRTIIIAVEGD